MAPQNAGGNTAAHVSQTTVIQNRIDMSSNIPINFDCDESLLDVEKALQFPRSGGEFNPPTLCVDILN